MWTDACLAHVSAYVALTLQRVIPQRAPRCPQPVQAKRMLGFRFQFWIVFDYASVGPVVVSLKRIVAAKPDPVRLEFFEASVTQ
jgi:hypothetical protein